MLLMLISLLGPIPLGQSFFPFFSFLILGHFAGRHTHTPMGVPTTMKLFFIFYFTQLQLFNPKELHKKNPGRAE